ncbi:MAG: diguanylate cyclase, partial [Solirubrobacterales bacterium]|nr:diguanylate cyclase [Solirubrobacterales bacterium]
MLLEAAPSAIAVYDVRGARVRANDRAAELLWHGEVAASAESLILRVLERGEPVVADDVLDCGDKHVTLSWHAHPIRRRNGSLTGAMLIGDDPSRTARLQALAMADPLTGVINQGAFRDKLEGEVALANRHGRPLSLALLDIDEFKVINDTFGHPVGDRVLVGVVATIVERVRQSDVLARIGGDEFAILMPETDSRGAAVIVERAHAAVSAAPVADGHRVTLSAGICQLDEGEGPEDFVGRADRALYGAKAEGRDKVLRYDADRHALQEALVDLGAAGPLARGQAAAAVRALARAIDVKDGGTRRHSDRVAELAVALATAMGWAPPRCELIHQAAVVHDVGKIAVPDAVLLKPGPLTDAELELVRDHAVLGAQIAGQILTAEQTSWVRSHHERFDGTGYPDALAADGVADGAQILAVADAYDVMVSDRPYAAGRDPTEALGELQRCAGTQFAPGVVAAFHTPQFVRLALIHSHQERSREANRNLPQTPDGRLELRCECPDLACPVRL